MPSFLPALIALALFLPNLRAASPPLDLAPGNYQLICRVAPSASTPAADPARGVWTSPIRVEQGKNGRLTATVSNLKAQGIETLPAPIVIFGAGFQITFDPSRIVKTPNNAPMKTTTIYYGFRRDKAMEGYFIELKPNNRMQPIAVISGTFLLNPQP